MTTKEPVTLSSNGLSEAKRRLLERRLQGTLPVPETTPTPPPRIEGPTPLSFAQQRLWFLDQLQPGSPMYNMTTAVRLRGPLNSAALRQALQAVVDRHEILRTRFSSVDGEPRQSARPVEMTLPLVDLSRLAVDARETELRRLLEYEARRPFDLSEDVLLRASLFRLGNEEHALFLNMHHIASDAWSFDILFRELTAEYSAALEGQKAMASPLPMQYADYAWRQRQALTEQATHEHLAYWRQQLAGAPVLLELPTDHPRPRLQSYRGGRCQRRLPAELAAGLKTVSHRHGATLFMTLLATYQILLHRLTRQTDLLAGIPASGRNQVETETLIGFFVNTLIVRSRLEGNPTFDEFLRQTRQNVLGAHAHQDLPFERLVEALCPDRTPSYSPLVQTMFALQSALTANLQLPGVTAQLEEIETGTAKFDAVLAVTETPAGLVADLEYSQDLLTAATAERWLGLYQRLLEGIVENPQQRVYALPWLTAEARAQVVCGWNQTAVDYPRASSVPELLARIVAQNPEAVAVVHANQHLTYHELNQRANQLASYLHRFGVRPGQCVGVYLERSPGLIIALLAILKAGAAYLPLDRSYPKERLAFMLSDAQAPLVLTEQKLAPTLPEHVAQLLCLDTHARLIAQEHTTDFLAPVNGENLAYVIYTSGSTGEPKGVCVSHRAILRLVTHTDYAPLGPEDVMAQASNCSFDAGTWEIWGALLNGARLVIIPTDLLLSPREFAMELQQQQVTALFLTTALFNELAAEIPTAFSHLRHLLFGGEAVDPRWVREVLRHSPPARLVHVYGPTECTTFATWHLITHVPDQAHTIPIGRPLANTTAYVLDPHLQPVPPGVPGELFLGGDGVADGYLGRPELTGDRFLPDTLGKTGGRLYKTGDLVRWLPQGEIEYLGRMDQQVKIRGFRVELGEIETCLAKHPGVRQCVIAVRPDATGTKQLVAYVVPHPGTPPSVLDYQKHLRQHLPEFMVPVMFVCLPELPLTPNGKIDQRALPEPDLAPEVADANTAPRDDLEKRLQEIWETVLQVRPVGRRDKFFALGGHSLLALRLLAQVEKACGKKLSVATLFQHPTIEQLATVLRDPGSPESESTLVQIQPGRHLPPLMLVHGVGGGMLWGYHNLARRLDDDQPVYAFKSRGATSQEDPCTIEEMAEDYLRQLREFQPRGPYFLGGYCFGGVVAYEMARQLELAGEQVALLALINSNPPNSAYLRVRWTPPYAGKFCVNLIRWAANSLHWSRDQRRGFVQWKLRNLKRRLERWQRGTLAHTLDVDELIDLTAYPEDERRLWEKHVRALLNYHPQPYQGRVTIFRSPVHHLLCSFDPHYGWGEFAQGGVTVRIVPGAHEKIIEEPHVQTLAARLNESLIAARQGVRHIPPGHTRLTHPAGAGEFTTRPDAPGGSYKEYESKHTIMNHACK